MDGYDNKSLEELRALAKAKYNLDMPADLRLGDAVEWLRFQDAAVATRIEQTLREGTGSPKPTIQPVQQFPTQGQVIIPTIPGLQDLPKGEGETQVIAPMIPTSTTVPLIPSFPLVPTIPTIPGIIIPMQQTKSYLNDENTLRRLHGNPVLPWQTDLALLANAKNQADTTPVNPDATFQAHILHPDYRPRATPPIFTGMLSIPTIPTIPGIGNLPVIPVMKPTTQTQPGVIPIVTIPTATTPAVPVIPTVTTPVVPVIPTATIPVFPTLQPVQVTPTVPTITQVPAVNPVSPRRLTSPTRVQPKSPVRIISPPKSPTQTVVQTPAVPFIQPTGPVIQPTIPVIQPTVPFIQPTVPVIQPTVPVIKPTVTVPPMPTIPAMGPTTTQAPVVVPKITVPQMPQGPAVVPKMTVPQMPQVTAVAPVILKVAPPVVPVMTQPPVVPVMTQPPVVPVMTQPPVVPVMTQPPVVPVMTQPPVVPVMTQPPVVPVMTQPPVVSKITPITFQVPVGPIVPKIGQTPVFTKPTTPTVMPNIAPIFPTGFTPKGVTFNVNPVPKLPGLVTFNITPTAPTPHFKPPTPMGLLTAIVPTVQQTPVSPGFQAGAQVAGFTTIRNTTLNPTIPNVLGGQAAAPTFLTQPTATIPTVKMPTFNTVVAPVTVVDIKRPAPGPPQQGNRLPPAPGTTENIINVLNEIDPNRLIGGRIRKEKDPDGKKREGYSLQVLQTYANRLGLTVSGKRKQELIDDIQAVRREMGLM